MKIVFDYLAGTIDETVFNDALENDPRILEWLENLIDLKGEYKEEWAALPLNYIRRTIHDQYEGSISCYLEASEKFRKAHPNLPKWLDIGRHFDTVSAIVIAAFPETVLTNKYAVERDFYLNVIGDSIGGEEVEEKIAQIINQFPAEMGKTKRKKAAKEAIKECFHLEGSKRPIWAQEPEWPMGTNSPMKYVKTKKVGEKKTYIFQDVDTLEYKTVEQLY